MRAVIGRFFRGDEGATMVEYALLVALIAVVVIVAVQAVGTQTSATMSGAATNIAS